MFTNWGKDREQGLGAGVPQGHTEKHAGAHTHTPQKHTAALTDPETCPGHV